MRPLLPVLAALALCAACREPDLRPALPPGVRVDTYAQVVAQKVDVLWVVDNSGSMAPHQANLARNFQAFISEFVRSAVDFRIGVTTTDLFADDGRLREGRVLSPQTQGIDAAFGQLVRVGTGGSAFEAGLEAARRALERRLGENQQAYDAITRCQDACRPGADAVSCRERCVADSSIAFLRPDAFLFVVFVTDEEDKSAGDVRGYYRFFKTAKGVGNDGMVTTAAIIGDVPTPKCEDATAGERYANLSGLTGGELGSICDAEFASALERLARNAVGLRRKFSLGAAPNVQTLQVRVRYRCDAPEVLTEACVEVDRRECEASSATGESFGTVCTPRKGAPDGWEYEEDNRVVYFAGDSVPHAPSQVELQYYEEGKGP
jgi:hypothetical protein